MYDQVLTVLTVSSTVLRILGKYLAVVQATWIVSETLWLIFWTAQNRS